MAGYTVFLVPLIAVVAAQPVEDPVVQKLDSVRYQNMVDASGTPHVVDLWLKASDFKEAAKFNPDTDNVYHLFTRTSPSVSQPLLLGKSALIQSSNFSVNRRTVVLIHGWMNSATSEFFTVLVPAFLAAEDVNVISVDWSSGAGTINYAAAVINTVTSGKSVSRFLNWLSSTTGATPASFHLVGHSLGGHQCGIVGRNLDGKAAYITALDPAFPGWMTNSDRFQADDAVYTEVIHTNSGLLGYLTPLGQVDFYPNGGVGMPGCDNDACDHSRSYYYLAESIMTGGFNGTRCAFYTNALAGSCLLPGSLKMGGLVPKSGQSGIFYVETNADPTFSKG